MHVFAMTIDHRYSSTFLSIQSSMSETDLKFRTKSVGSRASLNSAQNVRNNTSFNTSQKLVDPTFIAVYIFHLNGLLTAYTPFK